MKFPIIFIGYDGQKLFSIESHGEHLLPIFTDASKALQYRRDMQRVLVRVFDDKRPLQTLVCDEPQQAIDIFQMIAVVSPDVQRAIINPVADSSQMIIADKRTLAELVDDCTNQAKPSYHLHPPSDN